MVDKNKLERVAQLTAERHLKIFSEEIFQKKAEFHRRGLVQSSCFEQALGELAVIKSRELAEAVADIVAQACGSDTYRYVEVVEKVYEKAKLPFLSHYRKNRIQDFDSSSMIKQIRQPVERQIAENFATCADELRLGMVRGKTILGSGSGNVNNLYNSVFVAGCNYGDIQVSRDRDNVTQIVDLDREALLQAIQGFREALASEDIPLEAREKLDDEVVNLEREAKVEKPDQARLKRLAKGLLALMKDFGIQVGSNLVVNYLPAIRAAIGI